MNNQNRRHAPNPKINPSPDQAAGQPELKLELHDSAPQAEPEKDAPKAATKDAPGKDDQTSHNSSGVEIRGKSEGTQANPQECNPTISLQNREGQPFLEGPQGGAAINQPWFVEDAAKDGELLHVPDCRGFHRYDPTSGAWENVTVHAVKNAFSNQIREVAKQAGKSAIAGRRNSSTLSSLADQLRGRVECPDAFVREFSDTEAILHCRNGMLRVSADSTELLPFAPKFRSREMMPIAWETDALCPKYLKMMRNVMSDEDIWLVERYAGQLLLGHNLSQTILIMEGLGGASKSTIVNLLVLVAGPTSKMELRTAHLQRPFEKADYIGKSLLVGADVPGNFLQESGAKILHQLTGGDRLNIERKRANERPDVAGHYNVVIFSNSKLTVKVDNDASAWARRLLTVDVDIRQPFKPVPNYSKKLLGEEGPGILCRFVCGLQSLLPEVRDHGGIQLSDAQQQRIDRMLGDSMIVTRFVKDRIFPAPDGALHSQTLYTPYKEYCASRNCTPISETAFRRQLSAAMREIHGNPGSENVVVAGKRARGYQGVSLAAPSPGGAISPF